MTPESRRIHLPKLQKPKTNPRNNMVLCHDRSISHNRSKCPTCALSLLHTPELISSCMTPGPRRIHLPKLQKPKTNPRNNMILGHDRSISHNRSKCLTCALSLHTPELISSCMTPGPRRIHLPKLQKPKTNPRNNMILGHDRSISHNRSKCPPCALSLHTPELISSCMTPGSRRIHLPEL